MALRFASGPSPALHHNATSERMPSGLCPCLCCFVFLLSAVTCKSGFSRAAHHTHPADTHSCMPFCLVPAFCVGEIFVKIWLYDLGGTFQAIAGFQVSDIFQKVWKMALRYIFECEFSPFRIQTLIWSQPQCNLKAWISRCCNQILFWMYHYFFVHVSCVFLKEYVVLCTETSRRICRESPMMQGCQSWVSRVSASMPRAQTRWNPCSATWRTLTRACSLLWSSCLAKRLSMVSHKLLSTSRYC